MSTLDGTMASINQYVQKLYVPDGDKGGIKPAPPETLATNLLVIRGLLVQMVEKVAEVEKEYRDLKSSRLDNLLKEGKKMSPAIDALDFDKDLIGLKVQTQRLGNYLKYVDGLCTAVQSVLRATAKAETYG